MSDKNFWNQYYQTHSEADAPSFFANWVIENYKVSGNLIELGCGNGRDSIFFAKNGIKVLGIDQCKDMVAMLNDEQIPNSNFQVGDFTRLDRQKQFDSVYSRFTLHSVNNEEAQRTLNWAFTVLRPNGFLLIEVRSVNDELFGIGKAVGPDSWFTDHYRRFIRFDQFVNEITEIGFVIDFSVESKGLAPYGESDPPIIRIVARKT